MAYNKYRVAKKQDRTVDGITFASKREAKRYTVLKKMSEAGEISDLVLQPRFPIVIDGEKICTYVADFRYQQDGEDVIEDVKGVITSTYRIKRKLMRVIHDIDIKET